MKYFIDTEFIEGFHKPLFGKRRHFIDLISIGIICEDGRTYQAISKEFRYEDADQWVKDNVLMPLYRETVSGDQRNYIGPFEFHKRFGKTNKKIAEEIRQFVFKECKDGFDYNDGTVLDSEMKRGEWAIKDDPKPEFYAYYADYDWVVFCSLFGRMIDLPAGFPMYCKDLKQILDEKSKSWIGKSTVERTQRMGVDITKDIVDLKLHPNYPKQSNDHSALDDAKWNFELYKFLARY